LLDLSGSSIRAHHHQVVEDISVAFSASVETRVGRGILFGRSRGGLWFVRFAVLPRRIMRGSREKIFHNPDSMPISWMDGWMDLDVDPRRELDERIRWFLGGRANEKDRSSIMARTHFKQNKSDDSF
jgi:hypothetical protein